MTREILEQALRPMLEQGIDTVVMGCTHFPFIIPIIKQIVGNEVQVIDPAPAVARQAKRLLKSMALRRIGQKKGMLRFITSGDLAQFKSLLPVILKETGLIQKSKWIGNQIIIQEK